MKKSKVKWALKKPLVAATKRGFHGSARWLTEQLLAALEDTWTSKKGRTSKGVQRAINTKLRSYYVPRGGFTSVGREGLFEAQSRIKKLYKRP